MTQSTALSILKTGASVFITGSAGTGKTYLVNEYIRFLRDAGVSVAITASTGIASTHLGGMTIHAWSGLGIRDTLDERGLDELETKQHLWKRLQGTDILIIDEVSMLHAHRLDMLDRLLRYFRKNENPFGGMQMVFVGDFFQLPPVTRDREVSSDDFVFRSESWKKLDPIVCYLSEQHRQNDTVLIDILNELRLGELSDTSREHLETRRDVVHTRPHTKLYTHNVDVDSINQQELARIGSEKQTYQMEHTGRETLVQALVKSCLAPEVLALCVGAKVMFVKNDPEKKYVNGTLGVIESFNHGTPIVRTNDGRAIDVVAVTWAIEEDGKVKASITQLPLRLAWAITIHKSQGMSLDAAEIDLSRAFTYGQGYVALSRLRTLDGLSLRGWHDDAFRVHPEVQSYDEALRMYSESAEEAYARMDTNEIETLQRTFVTRVGGEWPVEGGETKVKNKKVKSVDTYTTTRDLLVEGHTIAEVADMRNYTIGTVLTHIETLKKRNDLPELPQIRPQAERLAIILDIFKQLKTTALTPVFEYLKKADFDTTYEELRLARVFLEVE